jgi:hypothetical protein
MNPSLSELLTAVRAARLKVTVAGARLVIRGPKSAEALARQLLDRKAEVMAALTAPAPPPETDAPDPPAASEPDVPPGSRLYYQDHRGRPTDARRAFLWCWAGGSRWYYAAQHPAPA